MVLKTKVQIAGTTIKDDSDSNALNLVMNFEYEELSTRGISQLKLDVLKSITNTIELNTSDTIEIWTGYTTSTDKKIFSGYISEYQTNGGLITITAKDKLWVLVRQLVNHIYTSDDATGGVISAIAEDLIETYGGLTAQVVSTGTETGRILGKFMCRNANVYERLIALATAVGYQVWYEASTDKVHFEPQGYNSNSYVFTVGTEIIALPTWTLDTSQMVNDLRIDGAVAETQTRFPFPTGSGIFGTTTNFDTDAITLPNKPISVQLLTDASDPPTTIKLGGGQDSSTTNFYYVDIQNNQVKPATGTTFNSGDYAIVNYSWLAPAPLHLTDDDSITNYGTFKKEITLSDIITIADAEARGTELLDKLKEPFHHGELMVKSSSSITVTVGDTVRVIDTINNPNVDEDFTVTRKITKYPDSYIGLSVGDEKLRLDDWQESIDARIKRLEEKDADADDLLGELKSWADILSQIAPRYLETLTRAYNVASNIAIYDLNLWDDGTVYGEDSDAFDAEVKYSMQQFNDEYTEDFLDTDFKA